MPGRVDWPVFAVALGAVVISGCSGPTPPDYQGGGAVLSEEKPGAMRSPGWLQFSDLTLHLSVEPDPPKAPYVRGWIVGGLFLPDGEVQGVLAEPPPRRVLTRGWLHLVWRSFTPESHERPRRPPYVEGWHDEETGGFFPSSPVRYETMSSGSAP
jgi:hypothetical protein